jgi:hypothetical protein
MHNTVHDIWLIFVSIFSIWHGPPLFYLCRKKWTLVWIMNSFGMNSQNSLTGRWVTLILGLTPPPQGLQCKLMFDRPHCCRMKNCNCVGYNGIHDMNQIIWNTSSGWKSTPWQYLFNYYFVQILETFLCESFFLVDIGFRIQKLGSLASTSLYSNLVPFEDLCTWP